MKLFFACIIYFISGYYPHYAQSNADYFPYEKNNYWEYYWVEFGYPDTIVTLSVFDSVDSQGRKIAVFDSYFINPIVPPALLPDSGTYIIDTSLNVFTNWMDFGNEYDLVYKLNGNQGDQWVIFDFFQVGGQGYSMARIREISDYVVLGIPTKIMDVVYYWTTDSTDTTGFERGGDVLAKGFGLLGRTGEGFPSTIILKGAVIDGVLYGDTTNIIVGIDEENQFKQPESFELYQNYPNPFNPITNIRFQTANFGFVSLKVYDVLGNEVAILVNEEKPAGEYEITFNDRNLASDIYLYQFKTDDKTISKKMILLK